MKNSSDVPLILASRSPRRRELLFDAGYVFRQICPSCVDEPVKLEQESLSNYVQRLAKIKAEDVAKNVVNGVILGCDTLVLCREKILGQPEDKADARRMLQLLRGEEHHVLSGLCLVHQPSGNLIMGVDRTILRMREIDDSELEDYLTSGLWIGKAGGFGLQDRTGWIEIVSGSASNVVGLPLELLARLLHA